METIIENNEIRLINDNKIVGKVLFIEDKDSIRITSTIVNPEFRGQGIARILMEETIKTAKEKGLKIVPICSYAVSFFQKNSQYSDLIKD